jgi:class 3 adenylate cyclase/tetratricopeptide (TPR) repeat protein
MSCPRCQHPSPVGAKFCNQCGAKLDVACAACGHGNVPGSHFCSECGAVLGHGGGPRPAATIPPHLAARILTSRSALEGERKQVTILLADLKGSMELLADRDPEDGRRLLDPVLELMIEAVHHYEGTVNQVMGDGIMALFGAPLAHEDHALRACYAALRMQARAGHYGDEVQRSHGVPLQIRVGINSGDVVVRSIGSDLHMDYTAVGQSTHLAARLEQMAKPGSTLITVGTLRLVEGYVQVRALGRVPIKGLPEPLEVFELLASGPDRTRLQVAAARGLTRFVGRDAELAQLRTTLEAAGAGRGQVIALVGEPGVGKSRLVRELVRSHRTDGWLVLEANAVSYGQAASFLPVVELLRDYFGVQEGDDDRRVREKLTGRLLTLDEGLRVALPALEALLVASGGDVERGAVLDAARRLLVLESRRQPVVVSVDDLHWIDPDTQALLDSLVDSVPAHRLLLLLNYRPEYRHDWGGRTYYTQIRLDPLPPETAEGVLEALLGTDPSLKALIPLLVERTQGNPFFIEESVRMLAETGALAGERGAHRFVQAPATIDIPATVQAILAARIDRLSPADKHLLQCASVVGIEVPRPLLAAVAEVDEPALAAGLDRLRSGEFLYESRIFPDVAYTFRHALTHQVAYGGLLHDRRRTLHARVVDAIERRDPDHLAEHRDQLVHHAFRAEMWTKAVAHLHRLNDVASPEEIGTLVGAGPESPGRLWWIGDHERATQTAERDLAVGASFGNVALRISSTCRLGQARHARGDYRRAAGAFRQVVNSLGNALAHEFLGMAAFASVWARSWLAWTLAELGELEEAAAVGERAAAIAESGAHDYSRVQAAFGRGHVHVVAGRPERAIPILEEGLVIARVAHIPFLVPFVSGPLGAAYAQAGRVDEAVALLEQTLEQTAAMGLVALEALRLVWLGEARRRAGRREAALEAARRALALAGEHGEHGNQAYARSLLGVLMAEGDAGERAMAEALHREVLQQAEELGMRPLADRCRLALAAYGGPAPPTSPDTRA